MVLQNCHLATSWLPNLTSIWEEIISSPETHPEFRLWLTSYPSDNFPTSLLQAGIKITVQRPMGIKPNLLSFYQSDLVKDEDFYAGGKGGEVFQRLLFSICFFHGVVEERRHYGPIGWNIPYEFNISDLTVSARQLFSFLEKGQAPPWDALTYLTAECNYGGRITDTNDRRLVAALLSKFYNKDVCDGRGYKLSPSGTYRIPLDLRVENCRKEIRSLPDIVLPEALGLNENAAITRESKESSLLLTCTLATQPQVETVGELEEGSSIQEELSRLISKVPNVMDSDIEELYPASYDECLNTVLRLEVDRYNQLIEIVRTALQDLQGALKGEIIMSLEIEDTLESVRKCSVPLLWLMSGFPSKRSLEGYIENLAQRVTFYNKWIEEGIPKSFWLSGFFNHHSFISALKQNYARKEKCSVDEVVFEFSVQEDEEIIESGEQAIHGLFIEGARWNTETKTLDESLPKVQYSKLPPIKIKTRKQGDALTEHPGYKCPVYVTQGRWGETNTIGNSTNFIFYIYLPTDKDPVHWTNRGVAALCQIDI